MKSFWKKILFQTTLKSNEEKAKFITSDYKLAKALRELKINTFRNIKDSILICLLYTSPSPRDRTRSRMPSSA